jgi:serine/threonine protein phosphatase PrpC
VSHIRPRAGTWAVACSRIGPSHVRQGKPCQDASAVWSSNVAGRSCLIAAVADGHGDDRHDQSQHGSRIAVQAAIADLAGFYSLCLENGLNSKLIAEFKNDFPRRIVRQWRQSVERDALYRLGVLSSPDEPAPADLVARYGTTLLVAFAFGGKAVVGQLGDGLIGVVHEDGTVEQPLALEILEVGSLTDSLCGAEAHLRWRTASIDLSDGRTLVLSTDGVTNAFPSDEELSCFLSSVQSLAAEHGASGINTWLPEWLDRYATASGDDVSLAILMLAARPSDTEQDPVTSETNAASAEPEQQVTGGGVDVVEAGPAIDGGGDGNASDGETQTG